MELYGKMIINGISPDYFWYDMEEGEIAAVIVAAGELERQDWERARLVAWSSAFCMGNPKKISPDTFLPFNWDNKKVERKDTPTYTKDEQSTRFNNLVTKLKL